MALGYTVPEDRYTCQYKALEHYSQIKLGQLTWQYSTEFLSTKNVIKNNLGQKLTYNIIYSSDSPFNVHLNLNMQFIQAK